MSSTGDAGEGRVQLYMEERGWKLIEGGVGLRTEDFDLVFKRGSHVLVTQIKTSSADDGRILYRNTHPHESANALVDKAIARSGRAIMVLVHLPEAPTITLVTRDGHPVLETTMPEPSLITWADPVDFAAKVEKERDEYASSTYLIGKRKGQPRRREGLWYPVCVDEFPALSSLLEDLEVGDEDR
ncbi:hypothetical protein ACIBUY_03830 [Streptomyces sp. NPDC050085]|uniref:hypothetical protein n=1 Tax=Streptomyces sp. NPDC050085 TaxID=3365600 RepID=UPI0037B38EC6